MIIVATAQEREAKAAGKAVEKAEKGAQRDAERQERAERRAEEARQKRNRRQEIGMARSLNDLKRIEKERGYNAGWADRVWAVKGASAQRRAKAV